MKMVPVNHLFAPDSPKANGTSSTIHCLVTEALFYMDLQICEFVLMNTRTIEDIAFHQVAMSFFMQKNLVIWIQASIKSPDGLFILNA